MTPARSGRPDEDVATEEKMSTDRPSRGSYANSIFPHTPLCASTRATGSSYTGSSKPTLPKRSRQSIVFLWCWPFTWLASSERTPG